MKKPQHPPLYLPLTHITKFFCFLYTSQNLPLGCISKRYFYFAWLLERLSSLSLSLHLHTPSPSKQLTSSAPLMFSLSRFTSSFLLSRSPLRWAAWSAPLFVSLPVGVNNLTTELLQSWLPSSLQIGTVCLFMTLCGGAHVWDVLEWEEACICVCVCVCRWGRACVSLLDNSQ